MFKINSWQIIQAAILTVCIVVCAMLFVGFFQQIPLNSSSLAIDWKGLWSAIQGASIHYSTGFRIAPWSALLVSPLGLLSLSASWGLVAFITVLILILSVPRIRQRRRYWLGILLLVVSFPSLRHMADGNFEGLVIAGGVLAVYGYDQRKPFALASGLLLLASKPQSGTLLIAVIGLYGLIQIWQPAQRRFWMTTAIVVIVIVIPSILWKGGEWLSAMFSIQERGSIMDISVTAALSRTSFLPSPLVVMLWGAFIVINVFIAWRIRFTLNREKAGMLIAASLLIAPYAAGNSLLTVLAVGVIPLFQARPPIGLFFIIMMDCLILWNKDMLFYYQASFQSLTLLLIWATLAYRALKSSQAAVVNHPSVPLAPAH